MIAETTEPTSLPPAATLLVSIPPLFNLVSMPAFFVALMIYGF